MIILYFSVHPRVLVDPKAVIDIQNVCCAVVYRFQAVAFISTMEECIASDDTVPWIQRFKHWWVMGSISA